MNFIEVKKKNVSLLTHKKTQPSLQPHAGFFKLNDAIPAHFLAHAQTFDRGVGRRLQKLLEVVKPRVVKHCCCALDCTTSTQKTKNAEKYPELANVRCNLSGQRK